MNNDQKPGPCSGMGMGIGIGIGKWLRPALFIAMGMMLGSAATLQAQQNGVQRTILSRHDVATQSAPQELVMGTAEIAAGSWAGRHSHHGMEIGYVLNGTVLMDVAGEAARTLKAGDHYRIEAGKLHDVKVTGDSAAKVLAIYLVEKGKPLAEPAP